MIRFANIKHLALRLFAASVLLLGSFGFAASASAAPALKATPKAAFENPMSAPVASKAQVRSDAVRPNVAWTASLTPSSQSLWPTQYATITASTNQDVGPTPYYLSVYDQTAGTYVAICASGTTCAASVTQASVTTHYYVAYVSSYPSTYPPANIQATSATAYISWHGVSVTLQATTPTVGVGATTTLKSTTSADIGPSPFYTYIYDTTTGARIGFCGAGTVCTGTTSQAVATTHRFVAYVAGYSASTPLVNVQATSNAVFSTWTATGYRIGLSATRTAVGQDTLTATTNVNVGPTPHYIEIFNANTGVRLTYCGSGTSCSVTTGLGFGTNNFVAFISSYSTTLPPTGVQANSANVSDFYFPIIVRP